jgi:ribosomal-protein-alanine N-acetyltransferase
MQPENGFPVLKTQRLLLRELLDSDAARILAIHGNAEAMRFFGTEPICNLEEAQLVISRFHELRTLPGPGARWAIVDNQSNTLIGTCGVFGWNRNWHKCGIGYELHPEAQGHGFMREGLSAVFSWAFEAMSLNRIEAQVHPENSPSLKLLSGLGFQNEGLLREVAFWGGKYRDLHQLSLLKAEWFGSKT